MKFSRQSRLLKAADFKSVFQQPIRSGDECFRILARVNRVENHRLGMAVSKNACATAVGRNRIKRVIRENFRNVMAVSKLDQSLDVVVIPKAAAAAQTNKELDRSLSSHWQRLIRKAENRINGGRQDQKRTDR